MRALIFLLIALGALEAPAQALRRYMGDRPTATGRGSACVPRPASASCWGNSLMQGAASPTPPPARLAEYLPGWSVQNKGVSGETATQIISGTGRYLTSRDTVCNGTRCGAYVFEGGTNDLKAGSGNPEAVLVTMQSGVEDALSLDPPPFVLWYNIPPMRGCVSLCGQDTSLGWAKIQEYNAAWATACAELRRENPTLMCLDIGAGTSFEDPDNPGYLNPNYAHTDGLHFKQAGSDAMASLAATAITALLAPCQ